MTATPELRPRISSAPTIADNPRGSANMPQKQAVAAAQIRAGRESLEPASLKPALQLYPEPCQIIQALVPTQQISQSKQSIRERLSR